MALQRRTPLRRTGPIKAKPRPAADRVTDELFEYLYERDGGCMAPILDPTVGPCRDIWGAEVRRDARWALTVEHCHDGYGKAAKRAKSDRFHTLLLCRFHGVQNWELVHKDEERDYLLRKEGPIGAGS